MSISANAVLFMSPNNTAEDSHLALPREHCVLHKEQQIDVATDTKYLDPLLIADPPIAMQQTVFELSHMTEIAQSAVQDAKEAILDKNLDKGDLAKRKEDILDDFQRKITAYLIQVSEKDLDSEESKEYPLLLHSVNDIEKIGDYCKNLAGYAEMRIDRKLEFSPSNVKALKAMFGKLNELFEEVILLKGLQVDDNE